VLTCHTFLHKSGCLPKQGCTFAGVLGSMLTDDEAGRVKLTRVAINVGKVPLLVSASGSRQQQLQAACIPHGIVAGVTLGVFPAACSHSVIAVFSFVHIVSTLAVCCCDAQHAYAAVSHCQHR